MPLVVVNRNPEKLSDRILKKFLEGLPESVASTLTCENPDGKLKAQDIEVWVQDFGPYDINKADVEIIIWANQYPERQENLDFRRKMLCNLVRSAVPRDIKGWVWILLQPASFGEF